MQAKIEKMGEGFGLLLPKELLNACGIGEKATVIVQNRTLIVAALDWRPRQGWDEALDRVSAAMANEEEDEETLAHWTSLPATAGSSSALPEAVFREEATPYGNTKNQGGA